MFKKNITNENLNSDQKFIKDKIKDFFINNNLDDLIYKVDLDIQNLIKLRIDLDNLLNFKKIETDKEKNFQKISPNKKIIKNLSQTEINKKDIIIKPKIELKQDNNRLFSPQLEKKKKIHHQYNNSITDFQNSLRKPDVIIKKTNNYKKINNNKKDISPIKKVFNSVQRSLTPLGNQIKNMAGNFLSGNKTSRNNKLRNKRDSLTLKTKDNNYSNFFSPNKKIIVSKKTDKININDYTSIIFKLFEKEWNHNKKTNTNKNKPKNNNKNISSSIVNKKNLQLALEYKYKKSAIIKKGLDYLTTEEGHNLISKDTSKEILNTIKVILFFLGEDFSLITDSDILNYCYKNILTKYNAKNLKELIINNIINNKSIREKVKNITKTTKINENTENNKNNENNENNEMNKDSNDKYKFFIINYLYKYATETLENGTYIFENKK